MQLVVSKETNLGVTTGIKAGGKIHGVVGFKKDSTKEPFTAQSPITPITWAEAPKDDSGKTEEGGDKGDKENKEEDSATSMAVYGATLLAAVSALAF